MNHSFFMDDEHGGGDDDGGEQWDDLHALDDADKDAFSMDAPHPVNLGDMGSAGRSPCGGAAAKMHSHVPGSSGLSLYGPTFKLANASAAAAAAATAGHHAQFMQVSFADDDDNHDTIGECVQSSLGSNQQQQQQAAAAAAPSARPSKSGRPDTSVAAAHAALSRKRKAHNTDSIQLDHEEPSRNASHESLSKVEERSSTASTSSAKRGVKVERTEGENVAACGERENDPISSCSRGNTTPQAQGDGFVESCVLQLPENAGGSSRCLEALQLCQDLLDRRTQERLCALNTHLDATRKVMEEAFQRDNEDMQRLIQQAYADITSKLDLMQRLKTSLGCIAQRCAQAFDA